MYKGLVTLVIGLPGSGKTHYVNQNLRDGVVYDLDYIAAAFRLSNSDPHCTIHREARLIANSLVPDFVKNAKMYSRNVFVIRTAPAVSEVEQISPDRIVICKGSYNITKRPDYKPVDRCEHLNRIQRIINYANANDIKLEEIK